MTNAQALENIAQMMTSVAVRQENAIKNFEAVKSAVFSGAINRATAEAQTVHLAAIKNRAEEEMDSLLKVAARLIAEIMVSEVTDIRSEVAESASATKH